MDTFDNLWGMIKAHFFYSAKSTIATIFLVIGAVFVYLLLKDNYEKLPKTLRNLVGAIIFTTIAFALF